MDTVEAETRGKIGRPDGTRAERQYAVHADHKVNGRIQTGQVCSLPARSSKQAAEKGQNFCTAFGYDFSHVAEIF